MPQMLCGTTPEEVRDEIAAWLDWHAKRQATEGRVHDTLTQANRDRHRYASEQLAGLADDLRMIPPAPSKAPDPTLVPRLLGEAAGCENLIPRASVEPRWRDVCALIAPLLREAAGRIQALEAEVKRESERARGFAQ